MFKDIIKNLKNKYKSLIDVKDVYRKKHTWITFEANGQTYTKRYDNLMKVKNIKKYIENGCTSNTLPSYLTPEIMKAKIKEVHKVDIILHDIKKAKDSQLFLTFSLPNNPEVKYFKRYHEILKAKSIYNLKPIHQTSKSYYNDINLFSLMEEDEEIDLSYNKVDEIVAHFNNEFSKDNLHFVRKKVDGNKLILECRQKYDNKHILDVNVDINSEKTFEERDSLFRKHLSSFGYLLNKNDTEEVVEEENNNNDDIEEQKKIITDTMEKWKTLISKIDDLKKFAETNFKDNFDLDIGVKNVDSITLMYFKDLLPNSKMNLDI